jgi:hypothetical protein
MFRYCCAIAACLILVAGCGNSSDEEPEDQIGKVGQCYGENSNKPVACSKRHLAETVFVSEGSAPTSSAALAECRSAQSKYLGQDFNTRLDVQLWVAEDDSWYRCDVLLRNSTKSGAGFQSLTGSLKGVLDKGVSVDLQSCLDEPFDASGDQQFVTCADEHAAQELVAAPAIGTLDEAFPDNVSDRAARACNAAASAVGLLGDDRQVRAYYPKNAGAWATGERTADCWVTATKGGLPAVKATN